MAKQVCDLVAGKGMTTSQSNEHLRKANNAAAKKRWSGNYDPTRERLNFEVTKGGVITEVNKNKSIPRRIKESLDARGIWDPNNGQDPPTRRTVANFILGGSREQMHRLAFGEQLVNLRPGADNSGITRNGDIEKWAVDTYNFMAAKYGEDNIVAFVVHLDEMNPHVHATVLPVTEQNKISFNKFFGGSKKDNKLKQLHDELAEVNKKYDLERGDDVNITGARHRSTEEYHIWKEQEEKRLEEEISIKQKQLDDNNTELSQAQRRVKGLTTMLLNLENQKVALEEEIAKLEMRAQQGEMTLEELEKQKTQLRSSIDSVVQKIKERQKQIQMARQQLQDVADRRAELDDQAKEIEKKIKQDLPTLHEKTMRDGRSTGWQVIRNEVKDCKERMDSYVSTLPEEERQIFKEAYDETIKGSLFEEIAERADEIAAVSAALFLGYVDQATQFAQSHGGGGGPDGGWGRGKDDDDEAWRRKCFFMGMKMMRPAPKLRQSNKPKGGFKR